LISWIKGEIITSWEQNQKFYVLINTFGLGYEIQTLKSLKKIHNQEIILWIHQIKREDLDFYFGFISKEERDFFRDLLRIKGIGPQIGMSLLSKYSLSDIIKTIINENKKLLNSVPGIGQKMTDRIFFELKNKFNNKNNSYMEENKQNLSENNKDPINNSEFKLKLDDINLTLNSLAYSKKEIEKTTNSLLENIKMGHFTHEEINKKFTFEILLKEALNILEKN